MLQQLIKKPLVSITSVMVLTLLVLLAITTQKAEAACPAVDTSRGSVTSTFTVAQAGTYTVWSRIMANGTNDSYILEIDGTTCGVTVGNLNNSASGWNWINYRDGNTSSKITVNLTAGSHSMTMIGREDGVQLEQVLFVSDASCVPSGADGGVCAITDATPPNVSITSPTNNQVVTGTVNIQANASDTISTISKVEFYMGSTLLNSDSSSPYAYALNTSLYPAGTYQLSARAYDSANNSQGSQPVTITIPPPPDTKPPTVTVSSPINGQTVSGTISVNASPVDESGISKVEFLVDGVLKNSDSSSPYSYSLDTTSLTNGSRVITARAYDAAPTPNSATASVTVTVNNPVAPTVKPCDFNNDQKVNVLDLSTLLRFYQATVPVNTSGDCTSDGKVTVLDLSALLNRYEP